MALLIALGFEFVNGFHDTANAVATVIYTHSLEPNIAVVWSGLCNLVGVLTSTGTVAFTVITLLPVELILQVSSGAGFAMVFALLIAAILWNLGTWWFGLPASSSHTMVGSIIGVGLANQLMNGTQRHLRRGLGAGHQGLQGAAHLADRRLWLLPRLLFLLSKWLIKYPALYEAPKEQHASAVAHSRPAGAHLHRRQLLPRLQRRAKGHGPDHAHPHRHRSHRLRAQPRRHRQRGAGTSSPPPSRPATSLTAMSTRTAFWAQMPAPRSPTTSAPSRLQPDTILALRELVEDLNHEVALYKEFKAVPANQQTNVRNDMYVASEAIRLMQKNDNPAFTAGENAALDNYKSKVDKATKFIPTWVKVAVALALGMGTMVGWKRIVVTVGEKIGKEHLTYAQGACAELVAMGTIFAADNFGLPVSTTHVLSSGVAGTMAANGSGLQLVHHSQHRGGLGLHPPRRGAALRLPLLALPPGEPLRGFETGFGFLTEVDAKISAPGANTVRYICSGSGRWPSKNPAQISTPRRSLWQASVRNVELNFPPTNKSAQPVAQRQRLPNQLPLKQLPRGPNPAARSRSS